MYSETLRREDNAERNAYDEDFVMAVDDRVYSGKNAREEAGEAIMKTKLSLLWEDGQELKPKRIGHFKGFTLMSSFSGREGETPKLYLRGKHTYGVNLNTENPFGTIASMEYALCRLNIDAEEEKAKFERMEKALADYQEQLGRRALCASSGERVGERRMIYHLKTLTFFQADFMASQPTHTADIVIGAKKAAIKRPTGAK